MVKPIKLSKGMIKRFVLVHDQTDGGVKDFDNIEACQAAAVIANERAKQLDVKSTYSAWDMQDPEVVVLKAAA